MLKEHVLYSRNTFILCIFIVLLYIPNDKTPFIAVIIDGIISLSKILSHSILLLSNKY